MKKTMAVILCCILLSVSAAFAQAGAMTIIAIPQTEAYCLQAGIDSASWADEAHAPNIAAALIADYVSANGSIPGEEVHGASVIVTEVDGRANSMAYVYLNGGQTLIIIYDFEQNMTFATIAPIEMLAGQEPSDELCESVHQILIGNYIEPANFYVSKDVLTAAMAGAQPAGDVTGTWTAQLLDAVAVMELNADGSAILTISPNEYSFTWTLNGTSLVLDQNGVELPAEYNGTTISLPLGNNVLIFTRSDSQAAGDITGTWTAQLLDAVAVMELNADGSASLTISPNVYSFTWTLNGTSLVLDQNGVELPAEYDGSTISLPLGTNVLIFTK